ncbi:clathrin heavy chain 1 [Tanacetum coccineum]
MRIAMAWTRHMCERLLYAPNNDCILLINSGTSSSRCVRIRLDDALHRETAVCIDFEGAGIFNENLYEAAKIIYGFISNLAKLAVTLVRLQQFQGAVDAARKANKANSAKTFSLPVLMLRSDTFLFYDIIGSVSTLLLKLLEWSRFGTCSHGHLVMDAITEKYDASSVPTALMPLDICHKPMNMPFLKVVSLLGMDVINLARIEAESGTWIELDKSVPPMDGQAWERTVSIYGSEQQFKDTVAKVANVELYCKVVHFYLQEHPGLINDVLNGLTLRVGHTHVVDIKRKAGHLHLVKPYMVSIQTNNVSIVNEALNEITGHSMLILVEDGM